MKRILFFFSCAVLLLITACGQQANQEFTGPNEEELQNLNEADFPIVKEEITLDFFARHDPASNSDWNDVMIFNEYEHMTNIDINWRMIPNDSLSEQLNLAFGGGNLPDAFHSAFIGSSTLMKYGDQGVLIPLNDLIDRYAPNFKKVMEEYPEIKQSITMPDGNIYAFPMMGDPDFLSYRTSPMMYINEKWLDQLGMDMPETTEAFYEYLQAVKEQNPSQGGVEEVPFGAPSIGHLYEHLRGAFGVANKGTESGYIDLDPNTNDYRFYPVADNYKELLQYLNTLYTEGLIEKNIFTIEHEQYLANSAAGRYGSTVWYSPTQVMGEDIGGQYTGVPALEGPYGDKLFVNLKSAVRGVGAFAITNKNKYPASTVRWIDHFYGEEGIIMYFMGIEGETFEVNDAGELVYTENVLNDPDLSFSEQVSRYLTFPGGGAPSMLMEKYFRGAESSAISVEAAEKLKPDLIENPWPFILHTEEENKKLQGFGADIEKYVSEMRDKFISGTEPFSKWDEYVSELEKMGLEEYLYLEIKITALERQLNKS
ncbi:extracellular solute-binding protein [Bacillaceae bacterium SIJ1]|uniref:extracellular solute-binding protein n=1 Tax=Litoribacterium kuwaitense TaxID=1398745 RepID=UPI0013EE2F85|nr:extracellular solute-binding protein [Litoribacterium kuwaitense]NGP43839.1 extracellular solute-binding protein [Litoribacterium kuwaitense]